jgi:hypothetical protein
MTTRVASFIDLLGKEKVLVFERVKKFLIDVENLAPFILRESHGLGLLSINELAVIVQFLAYSQNFVIGPWPFATLTSEEKEILGSDTHTIKSTESPFYSSYIVKQDLINQLKSPSEHFWIYEPYRSVNVDQKIVDLLVVGSEKLNAERTWQKLIKKYELKRKNMMLKVNRRRGIFEELLDKGLALGVILRGSVGSKKRYPTENDVDIVILTPSQKTHSVVWSTLMEKVSEFKMLNLGDNESFKIDLNEEYELDVDLISAEWLPLHPIMARAQADIIDDSIILLGQEEVERYRSKLREIASRS